MTSRVWQYPELWDGCMGAWCPSQQRFPSNSLIDYSAAKNHGTLTNMDAGSDWPVSGGKVALDFDGGNDSVVMSSNGFNSANDLTVSFWVNIRSDTGGTRIVEKGGNNEWTVAVNDDGGSPGTIWFLPRNRHITADAISVGYNAGKWDHYACMLRSAESLVAILRNGVTVATRTQAGIVAANGVTSTYIAQYGGGGFNGDFQMDDLRIYTRALSQQEIATLALRRGIAYETKRRRSYKAGAGGAGPSRPDLGLLLGVS